MCTVVVQVPESAAGSVRLLAVRDEDPARAWDPPGRWWSDLPEVIGVRDRRAGGAWLAANGARLSVLLNRAGRTWADRTRTKRPTDDSVAARPSRGHLVLNDVSEGSIPDPPQTAEFNLVSVTPGRATVTSWDGEALRRQQLVPGVHMIDHFEVNDPTSPRITTWLPEFRALRNAPEGQWQAEWLSLLTQTARLGPHDDRAIIRDNNAHGYPTESLLVCVASLRAPAADAGPPVSLSSATLTTPGNWNSPEFRRAT